jgi:leucyl aminopeptidase
MTLRYSDFADAIRETLETHRGSAAEPAIPIHRAPLEAFRDRRLKFLSPAQQGWLDQSGWKPKPGAYALVPGERGLASVVLVEDTRPGNATLGVGTLAANLPAGLYALEDEDREAVLAWALGAYTFSRYLAEPAKKARLAVRDTRLIEAALATAQPVWFARELINLPANDLAPRDLAAALEDLGKSFRAETEVAESADLVSGFPLVHAVGRASDRAPCVASLVWGKASHPKVTLVGKGICFDTGGVNLKPAAAMALMKKDMAGAATAMALGGMIMAAKLPVRLRVIVACADNSVSGSAFRPGDILRSRSGTSVEISNTDAEGRLVLADALSWADEDEPDLMIDFATLTGSARVALGPDIAPFYTEDDTLAASLQAAGETNGDPVWRMPYWTPYDSYLKSKVADVNHASASPYAGSITAALFLKRFVKRAKRYAHLDIFGWVPKALPGKPAGGDPQSARALFAAISAIYGKAAS